MVRSKQDLYKLVIVILLFVASLLVVLPRIPITINNSYVNIDTSIGGYFINLFNNKIVLDLTKFKKGLDLEGGVQIALQADMSKIAETERAAALESAKEVIERRVNYLGVSEPSILTTKSGDNYRIVVEIPGIKDVSAAVALIGQTAQLSFKQLKSDLQWDESQFQQYFFDPTVWEDTAITGADLRGASVVLAQPGTSGQAGSAPQIQLNFTNDGRRKFEEVAKANVNKPIAIFLDENTLPLSMPVVSPELAQGLFDDPVITGTFDLDTAQALSVQIRAGALPIPVSVVSQKEVEATLGALSVESSIKAGVIGFALVLVFMLIFYGRFGLIADFTLVFYAVLVLAIFKLIPVVITLPGIAGFLLSIGVAVDANILVFERIREEVSWGKPKSLAVKYGFDRAWPAIRDSNVAALITAVILFYFGSGQVRGFAFTLAIGVIVSLFTAIFVVKLLIRILKLDKDTTTRFTRFKRLIFRKKYALNEI